MAQLGFHGLIGLGLGRKLYPKQPVEKRKPLVYGFVLGNLLPDADFFALAAIYLFDSELGKAMHRSFSHSLLGIILIAGLIFFLLKGTEEKRGSLALGITLGMFTHAFLDIFFWFSGIKAFWPLGLAGFPDSIDIWSSVSVPGLVTNLLGAVDYLAAGLYLLVLTSLARKSGLDQRLSGPLNKIRLLTIAQLPLFLIYLFLAFRLPGPTFDIYHYVVFILFLLPTIGYATMKLRPAIEEFLVAPEEPRASVTKSLD